MAFISGSVGENGDNLKNDVCLIQQAFNTFLPAPLLYIPETGICDQFLIEKIHCYQSTFLDESNGCIRPLSETVQRLWPVTYANPSGVKNTNSTYMGSLHSRASNGNRRRHGADYDVLPSQTILAPVSGRIIPMTKSPIQNNESNLFPGIEIHASNGVICQVWNITPNHILFDSIIKAGEAIGFAKTHGHQQHYYSAFNDSQNVMTSHIHVRLYDHFNQPIDPIAVIPAINFNG